MKALLVKDDGLIYAAEVPEEPKFGNPLYEGVRTELIRRDYQRKLASAKENAVLVSDQEKAKELIWQYGDQHNKPIVKPGMVVPIPDLQWEPRTVEKFYEGKGWFWETVAILKESTPSENQQIIDYLEARTQVAAIIRGKVDKSQVFGLTEQILQWAASQSTPLTEQEGPMQDRLWQEAIDLYCEIKERGKGHMLDELRKNFTITRRKP